MYHLTLLLPFFLIIYKLQDCHDSAAAPNTTTEHACVQACECVCVCLSLCFLPLSLLSPSISPFSLHSYLSLSHLSLSLSPFPISFLSLHISLPLSLSLPLFSHLYLSFSPPSLPLSLTKQNVIYLAHASFPINHIRPAPTAAESNLANTPQ